MEQGTARHPGRGPCASVEEIASPTFSSGIHALFQLMRWSGLAIRDALTVKRNELHHDKAKDFYRIVTARQKTGTLVSVPISPDVVRHLQSVANGKPECVFWSGSGDEESITTTESPLRKVGQGATGSFGYVGNRLVAAHQRDQTGTASIPVYWSPFTWMFSVIRCVPL